MADRSGMTLWPFSKYATKKEVETIRRTMNDLQTEITQLSADLAAVKTDFVAIAAGIATQNQSLKDLQQQLASATLTAAQQAALTQAVADADAVKAQADAIAASFQTPTQT